MPTAPRPDGKERYQRQREKPARDRSGQSYQRYTNHKRITDDRDVLDRGLEHQSLDIIFEAIHRTRGQISFGADGDSAGCRRLDARHVLLNPFAQTSADARAELLHQAAASEVFKLHILRVEEDLAVFSIVPRHTARARSP